MDKTMTAVEHLIHSASVSAVVLTITPEVAHKMLERNISNRPVSKSVVDRYADTMKKGLWQLNAQSIVFNSNGELTDGQHRLYAVIQSGCSIESLVAGGVSPEAFATYDCGRSRTLGQLIGMSGVTNYTSVAAVVSTYYALVNGYNHFDNKMGKVSIYSTRKPSNSEFVRMYNENADKYNFYGDRAARLAKAVSKSAITSTYAASVWMFLVEHLGYPQSMVQSFFLQLFSYDTSENSTIDLLRKKLLSMRGEKSANGKETNYFYTMQYKVDLLVKTWNYYATGREVKILAISDRDKGVSFLTPQQAEAMKNEN